MGLCAYCGKSGRMTREHIFPEAMARENYHITIDHTRDSKNYKSQVVVKDVCSTCNNNHLSKLDRYGQQLENTYFSIPITLPLKFDFSYNLLLRFLLKLLFNQERALRSPNNLQLLKSFTQYILGKNSETPERFQLFLGLIKPDINLDSEMKVFRFANLKIIPPHPKILAGEFVCIKQFVFAVLYWSTFVDRNERNQIILSIRKLNEMTHVLPGSETIFINNYFLNSQEYLNYHPISFWH